MFILKKGHQPGVYMPLRALFLVCMFCIHINEIVIGQTVLLCVKLNFVWSRLSLKKVHNFAKIVHFSLSHLLVSFTTCLSPQWLLTGY